jgi:hypothetical protein
MIKIIWHLWKEVVNNEPVIEFSFGLITIGVLWLLYKYSKKKSLDKS